MRTRSDQIHKYRKNAAGLLCLHSRRLSYNVQMLLQKLPFSRAVAFALLLSGSRLLAAGSTLPKYRLHLYNLHTGEQISVVYRIGKQYQPIAVARLDEFLRDWRTGAVRDYDVREFDLLHALMAKLGDPNGVIDIVCGYRTPHTNNWLRNHGHAVALHSQHIQAKAIDIRVPGFSAASIRNAALALHRGGVGYYPRSNFVHVDVGPVRRW
jgi:uncharacterized protein YcbK (DUF882 family)